MTQPRVSVFSLRNPGDGPRLPAAQPRCPVYLNRKRLARQNQTLQFKVLGRDVHVACR